MARSSTSMQDRLTAKLQEAVEKQPSDILDLGSEFEDPNSMFACHTSWGDTGYHTTRRNGAIGFSNTGYGSDTKQYNLKPMRVYVPEGSCSERGAPPPLQPMDDGTWTVTGTLDACEGTFGYCIQGDNFAKTILVMWYIKDRSVLETSHVPHREYPCQKYPADSFVIDNCNLWNIHIVPGQVTPTETIHNDLKKGACGYPTPIAPEVDYIVREFQDEDLHCELRRRMTTGPNSTLETGITYLPA